MLIDDNPDDNFFHERVIRKADAANHVIIYQSAREAMTYLLEKDLHSDRHPDLIFLDINMPGMNGWEFLAEYKRLDPDLQSTAIVIMLTTSNNPDDKQKAKEFGIPLDFKTKPLTRDLLENIIEGNF